MTRSIRARRAAQTCHPRGGVYVFVLATATLLVVMAVGSTLVIDAQSRRDATIADSVAARAKAQAALELASGVAQNTLHWRRAGIIGASGVAMYTIDGDTVKVETGDPDDDDLTDSIDEPIELLAEASVGDAREMLLVNLTPHFEKQECLDWSLRVGGNLYVYLTDLTTDAPVGANGSALFTLASSNADVYAGGTATGGTITGLRVSNANSMSDTDAATLAARLATGGTGAAGTSNKNGTLTSSTTTTSGATTAPTSGGSLANTPLSAANNTNAIIEANAVDLHPIADRFHRLANVADESMPDPNQVFRHYMYVGTTINAASIPGMTMSDVLLSPTSNPYGPTNAQGIYVIDCANQNLTLRNIRVLGTLVLLNTGSGTKIEKGLLMRPAVGDYPALLVRGKITLSPDRTLKEATGFNANPVGSPLGGITDSDTTGEYPSEVRGIVYVNGDLGVSTTMTFTGCVIASGDVGIGHSAANLPWTAVLATNRVVMIRQIPSMKPPPGFYKMPGFVVEASSARRITD